jgi:hypothetical protein
MNVSNEEKLVKSGFVPPNLYSKKIKKSRENTEQLINRDSNTAQNDKIWKRQERTERNVRRTGETGRNNSFIKALNW